MGAGIALTDGMVHQQDVRRPLGLWRTRGVRVVAEDLDWARGRGPEARGTGEQVLMVMAGRRGVAAELSGPGVDALVRRTG